MPFDAFTMPPAPRPPAGPTASLPGTEPALVKLDRQVQSADQKESFLATLNRASELKSSGNPKSSASEAQTAKPAIPKTQSANPANNRKIVDQDAVQDQEAQSKGSTSTQDSPFVGVWPVMDLIHEYLIKMSLADDGALVVDGQSDSNSGSTNAVLPQLMGHVQSEGKPLLTGLEGIGPFEQLQTDISPEASNLSFFKQLVNRAIVHQLAADPSGPHADNSFFEFWRSLTATPAEGFSLGGRTEAYAARAEELINLMLQRFDNMSPAAGLEAAAVEANGQKTAVNPAAFSANENRLLHKMAGAVQLADAQPSEMIQPASAEKDGRLSAGASKDLNVETLLEPRLYKSVENSQSVKLQPASKAAEPVVNTNLAAESLTAKPSEGAVTLKTSGLQTDMLPADQKGSKIVQVDGEAKGSSFLTSQKNLFEHPAKLEHAGRSAEGIPARPSEDGVSLKTSGLQTEMLPADQSGSKIVQIDGDAKDSSSLTSHENLFEHPAKLEHAGRAAEGAQRSLASQTMNQIVQKAVLLNNNGQNSVQIDLKPDFLGHIRMHIVTESQQVAVRIVAEFPFVKDMLESNLNQLKAELQAQGLEVDELEVSVAHDSRADDDLYQKAADARRSRALKENRLTADAAAEDQVDMHPDRGLGMAETAIDYFA